MIPISENTREGAKSLALVRRVVDEIWNIGNTNLADDLFSANYVNHGGLIPDLTHGPEAIKLSVALYRLAFPDFYVMVRDLSAIGNIVVLQWTAVVSPWATRDEMTGKPRHSSLIGSTRSRLVDGRIAESWTHWRGLGTVRGKFLYRRNSGQPLFEVGSRS